MSLIRRIPACLAAVSLALLASACDDAGSPTVPADTLGPAPAYGRADIAVATPFEASFFTDQLVLQPDARCAAPYFWNEQEGFGEATRLGRFSVRMSFCIDPSDLFDDEDGDGQPDLGVLSEGESLPYRDGTGTLVAADGSELFITIAGAVVPSAHPEFDFEFMDPFQIVGGTGRFEGASGEGTTVSLVNRQVPPTRTTHEWSGTLRLPLSGR